MGRGIYVGAHIERKRGARARARAKRGRKEEKQISACFGERERERRVACCVCVLCVRCLTLDAAVGAHAEFLGEARQIARRQRKELVAREHGGPQPLRRWRTRVAWCVGASDVDAGGAHNGLDELAALDGAARLWLSGGREDIAQRARRKLVEFALADAQPPARAVPT